MPRPSERAHPGEEAGQASASGVGGWGTPGRAQAGIHTPHLPPSARTGLTRPPGGTDSGPPTALVTVSLLGSQTNLRVRTDVNPRQSGSPSSSRSRWMEGQPDSEGRPPANSRSIWRSRSSHPPTGAPASARRSQLSTRPAGAGQTQDLLYLLVKLRAKEFKLQ